MVSVDGVAEGIVGAIIALAQQGGVGLAHIGELVELPVLALHVEAVLIAAYRHGELPVGDLAVAAVPGIGENKAGVDIRHAVLEEVVDGAVRLPGVARDLHGHRVAGVAGVGLIAAVVLAPAAAQQAQGEDYA